MMRILVLVVAMLVACNKGSSNEPAKKSAAPVCVAGTEAACAMRSGKWTGSLCCLDAPVTCVAGNEAACAMHAGRWTGSLCCMSGSPSCVEGKEADCASHGGAWTGSLCCME
jgi:hypothetical protein